MVDYRLAPKYPYPYALEDAYAALVWLKEHHQDLGIDADKLAVYGDSAGGNLAAALTHLCRDRTGNPFTFQALIYPVTDKRMKTRSMQEYTHTPLWNSTLNKKMWRLYLSGEECTLDEIYASPNQMENFLDIPPCYLETAEFDCLHDEGLQYGEKLKARGIETRLVETKGTIHGFEFNYKSPYTQSIVDQRIAYFSEKFEGNL